MAKGMTYLVIGEEEYAFEALVQKLREEYKIDAMNEIYYDMREQNIAEVVMEARTVSFFGNQKLLIVTNPYFLTAERKINEVEQDLDLFMEYLANQTENVAIVVWANYAKLDERKKVTKNLKKYAKVIEAQKVQGARAVQKLKEYTKAKEILIDSEAIDELLYLTNDSITQAIKELEKLSLYVDGEIITSEVVSKLVAKKLEHYVFDLADYVLNNNKAKALELYHELLLQGEDTIKLNYILLMQIRLILQIKILLQYNYQQNNISEVLKVHPYRVKKLMREAQMISINKLTQIYQQLVKTEYALKTGKLEPELLFEFTLLKLEI